MGRFYCNVRLEICWRDSNDLYLFLCLKNRLFLIISNTRSVFYSIAVRKTTIGFRKKEERTLTQYRAKQSYLTTRRQELHTETDVFYVERIGVNVVKI